MTNAILKSLHDRKSMRVFTDRPIDAETKLAVLDAAAQAPTAGNQQLYTIIDVTDSALKAALADSCDHQPMIAKAPMVLVFVADCAKWRDAFLAANCEPRENGVGDLMLAVTDACIAAQNAVVAAESLGLGSCYVGDIMENCQTQRELLKLPKDVFPCAMLIFGYPNEQQLARMKPPRFRRDFIVHENAYRRADEATLREVFAERDARDERSESAPAFDYDRWMTAYCNRKFNSAFSREMTRSVAEFLAEFER